MPGLDNWFSQAIPILRRLAGSIGRHHNCDSAVIDDLVNDGALRIIAEASRFDSTRGDWDSYAYSIALGAMRNRLVSESRYLSRHAVPDPEDTPLEVLATGPTPDYLTLAGLRQAMACLSDSERRAVEMYYYEGKTYQEMAAVCGTGETMPRKTVSAALAKLRREMN